MKKVHYTDGYGGKLNYKTTCGKEIHSHSETESATINPIEVTCKKCLATKVWIEDNADCTNTSNTDIKRRIFLESDILHADALRHAQYEVANLCEGKSVKHVRRVFSEVLDYAWHDLEKTWKAVKASDEIYADSSLMPLCGGAYMGAPVIFNGMMERTIKEDVRGKDVYILNSLSDIYWDMIDVKLMKKAFKYNNLYMYTDFDKDYHRTLVKVDVTKIKKK